MKHSRLSAILTLLLVCNLSYAHKVTETLSSPKGDKVSITYEITQKNGKVTICFPNMSKTLGNHGKKYQNTDDIVVLFFDRKGGYTEEFSGNIEERPFTIPAGLQYNRPSEDGYFIIGQSSPPKLTFDLETTETVNLSIPVYLAKHPRRGKYEVFQHCGNLNISIVPETASQSPKEKGGKRTETFEFAEEESSFSFEEEARQRIARINALLDFQDSQFSNDLINDIASLNALKEKVKDRNTLKEIQETISKCEAKKEELSQKAKQQESIDSQKAAKEQVEAEERQMYLSCMDIQSCEHYLELYPDGKYKPEVEAKLDKLKTDKENADAKQNKRTIWMIIGGGLMAVLLFVGNQAMQSFRNIKTQRSIMEMQKDVTKRAEGTAKRKAKSLIHNQTHQAMNASRNKGRDLMQKGVEKTKAFNPKNQSNKQADGTGSSNKAQATGLKKKTNSNKQISI